MEFPAWLLEDQRPLICFVGASDLSELIIEQLEKLSSGSNLPYNFRFTSIPFLTKLREDDSLSIDESLLYKHAQRRITDVKGPSKGFLRKEWIQETTQNLPMIYLICLNWLSYPAAATSNNADSSTFKASQLPLSSKYSTEIRNRKAKLIEAKSVKFFESFHSVIQKLNPRSNLFLYIQLPSEMDTGVAVVGSCFDSSLPNFIGSFVGGGESLANIRFDRIRDSLVDACKGLCAKHAKSYQQRYQNLKHENAPPETIGLSECRNNFKSAYLFDLAKNYDEAKAIYNTILTQLAEKPPSDSTSERLAIVNYVAARLYCIHLQAYDADSFMEQFLRHKALLRDYSEDPTMKVVIPCWLLYLHGFCIEKIEKMKLWDYKELPKANGYRTMGFHSFASARYLRILTKYADDFDTIAMAKRSYIISREWIGRISLDSSENRPLESSQSVTTTDIESPEIWKPIDMVHRAIEGANKKISAFCDEAVKDYRSRKWHRSELITKFYIANEHYENGDVEKAAEILRALQKSLPFASITTTGADWLRAATSKDATAASARLLGSFGWWRIKLRVLAVLLACECTILNLDIPTLGDMLGILGLNRVVVVKNNPMEATTDQCHYSALIQCSFQILSYYSVESQTNSAAYNTVSEFVRTMLQRLEKRFRKGHTLDTIYSAMDAMLIYVFSADPTPRDGYRADKSDYQLRLNLQCYHELGWDIPFHSFEIFADYGVLKCTEFESDIKQNKVGKESVQNGRGIVIASHKITTFECYLRNFSPTAKSKIEAIHLRLRSLDFIRFVMNSIVESPAADVAAGTHQLNCTYSPSLAPVSEESPLPAVKLLPSPYAMMNVASDYTAKVLSEAELFLPRTEFTDSGQYFPLNLTLKLPLRHICIGSTNLGLRWRVLTDKGNEPKSGICTVLTLRESSTLADVGNVEPGTTENQKKSLRLERFVEEEVLYLFEDIASTFWPARNVKQATSGYSLEVVDSICKKYIRWLHKEPVGESNAQFQSICALKIAEPEELKNAQFIEHESEEDEKRSVGQHRKKEKNRAAVNSMRFEKTKRRIFMYIPQHAGQNDVQEALIEVAVPLLIKFNVTGSFKLNFELCANPDASSKSSNSITASTYIQVRKLLDFRFRTLRTVRGDYGEAQQYLSISISSQHADGIDLKCVKLFDSNNNSIISAEASKSYRKMICHPKSLQNLFVGYVDELRYDCTAEFLFDCTTLQKQHDQLPTSIELQFATKRGSLSYPFKELIHSFIYSQASSVPAAILGELSQRAEVEIETRHPFEGTVGDSFQLNACIRNNTSHALRAKVFLCQSAILTELMQKSLSKLELSQELPYLVDGIIQTAVVLLPKKQKLLSWSILPIHTGPMSIPTICVEVNHDENTSLYTSSYVSVVIA